MNQPGIELHPAAIAESRKAFRWYQRRSVEAARRFQNALEFAIAEIHEAPDRWPAYLHGTRYRLLRRFPYLVVYRARDGRIQVVAVAHGRRKPGYWKRRT